MKTYSIFDNEVMQVKSSMEKMGVKKYISYYPYSTFKNQALVEYAARQVLQDEIKNLKEKMNRLYDEIEELKDKLI